MTKHAPRRDRKGPRETRTCIGATHPVVRRIFEVIDQRGILPLQFCEALRLCYVTFWKWRAGKALPRLFQIDRMAAYLGLTIAVLEPA